MRANGDVRELSFVSMRVEQNLSGSRPSAVAASPPARSTVEDGQTSNSGRMTSVVPREKVEHIHWSASRSGTGATNTNTSIAWAAMPAWHGLMLARARPVSTCGRLMQQLCTVSRSMFVEHRALTGDSAVSYGHCASLLRAPFSEPANATHGRASTLRDGHSVLFRRVQHRDTRRSCSPCDECTY